MAPRRYRWLLLALAIISLLLSSFIEYQTTPMKAGSWLQDRETYIGVSREVGFAFFIALVILFTVEEYNKTQQLKEFEDDRSKIKRDVFDAVFDISLPPSVRNAVLDNILGRKFIRSKSFSAYEIIPRQFKRNDGSTVNGVLLKAHCSSSVKNVSRNVETFEFKVFVEKLQLFNLKEPLKDANIDSVCIGGKPLSRKEIDEADLEAPDGGEAKRLVRQIPIQPGEEVPIDFSFSAVRGFDDSETWITLVPNDGMRLELRMPPLIKSFESLRDAWYPIGSDARFGGQWILCVGTSGYSVALSGGYAMVEVNGFSCR